MKIRYFYRSLLPLLVAFFNVMGSTVYSYNSPGRDFIPQNHDYLQQEQNTSALYLEEISTRSLVQVTSKNDLFTGSDLISGKDFFHRSSSGDNKLTATFIRDKKDILKTNIFPFHFFW